MKTEMKISLFGIMLTLTVFGAWLSPSVVRSDTYEVDVRPYEKERRAIPIDGSNPYDATLHIVPERDCGWVLADSKIIAQNLLFWRSDMTLWKPGGKTPGLHVYHLCNAVSSLEYVFITGTLTKRGNGGGGHTDLPWFDVMVPSVDIDWTGFGYETQGSATFEKYTADKFEDGEDTRIVPISTSVDHSLCSRFVINPPVDDTSLVTPMLELTWNYQNLLKVYDANWNQITSGAQYSARQWWAPKTFYVIAQPDTSPRVVEFVLQGQADRPFEGRGASGRPIDKIYGLIPQITVDLDVDSDYDGDIDNDDDALEENPGGLVRVRDALNLGLTEIQLSLPLGASGIVWMRLTTSGLGRVGVWEKSDMTTQWDPTKPIQLGSLGVPKNFYLEGLAASSLLGDVQIEVTYAKADGTYTSADKIALTVVKSDLDVDANYDGSISEVDDALEESAGGFTATNVLREINLAAFPGPHKLTSGGVILSAEAGGDKIKVWADQNKTTEITFDPKDPKNKSKAWSIASFPSSLYVEGIKASDTVRDVQLRLCYTNKTFSCQDLINLTVIQVKSIEVSCNKFGSNTSAGDNPVIFERERIDFGTPGLPPPQWWLPGTYEDSSSHSSQALKVFFKYIKTANDEPSSFDIDLKANVLPIDLPDNIFNMLWVKTAFPYGSGNFDHTDTKSVKFQNPNQSGFYRFKFSLRLLGREMCYCEASALLPKAGSDVTTWMIAEVSWARTCAENWETAIYSVADARGLDRKVFLDTAWKAIATADFDYQGIVGDPTRRYSFTDNDRLPGHVSDPNIPGMRGEKGNGDFDEPSFATLMGIVVSRAKINNAMYAVWGRQLGYSILALKSGAFYNAISRELWDDSTSRSAVQLGGDLYEGSVSGSSLSSILTKDRARSIQTSDNTSGLNDVNLWPNSSSSSGSGFEFPEMPTDYNSLKDGENTIPRGRLF